MSQPSKVTMNNKTSAVSSTTSDNREATADASNVAMKRTVSTEFEHPAKKTMLEHHSSEQQNKHFVTTSYPVQFVTGSQLATASSIHAIPEISDEELLAMAIMFEKEQQNQ